MAMIIVEFVAGPRCGQTETIERWGSPVPPLSLALCAVSPRDAAGPVYVRRDDLPNPGTDRWMYDYVDPTR